MTILVDHNMRGQAILLWGTLAAEGWLDLLPLRLATFADVGLPVESTDRAVWRFAQTHRMILLTGNRSMVGPNSLEQTIREENTRTSLPVITVGSVGRLDERVYRERCGSRLIEIVVDLDNYLGTGRLFIP
ncbi:MAG TPA: ACP S-malonyltransferase [Candidatus Binatia bacterium]|nr:ACP S-malonyltransferase [Candidatus Binatia bacterium]